MTAANTVSAAVTVLGSVRKHQLGGDAPTPRAKTKYPEGHAQREVVKWLRARPDWMVMRVENAARRTMAQVARDKALGMEPGAPDLALLYRWRMVWLEMKAPKNGVVSEEQASIHHQLRMRGQRVLVAHGHEEAIRLLVGIENEPS